MKIASLISRLLMGLIFLVFGLNGFLHFLPMPAPTGLAGQFFGALFLSHYLIVIFLVQVIAAVLLLINQYVPLALTLLGPVLVNILCFHVFMAPSGLPLALVVTLLWAVVFLRNRAAFAGLFERRPGEQVQARNHKLEGATR
jgi:putative oxidoreductase